jgi:undecaprenyl pyrophosphate phosphatase UppP
MKNTSKSSSLKRIFLLYVVYTFLFITLFSFLDYYDYYIINPYLLIVISVILGILLTYFHIKSKKKTKIDEIIKKL